MCWLQGMLAAGPWNSCYHCAPECCLDASVVEEREIYTVSQLNREVAHLLARSFTIIWLEGEISNFSQPRSGHMYFSLKDASAQVRVAMFRQRNLLLDFQPENGAQVLLRGRVSLYEPRGDYQLIAEHMEPAGAGALQRAFEELKRRLQAEGVFAAEHKQAIPEQPQHIGVITSATGAALRDVLSVLRRRYPQAAVLIYPVMVQGAEAVADICQTLRLASQRRDCEVLLLVRGGGSLEDLHAFNDEAVARAMLACNIPLVCGVGHEIDITIADFVADARAPTPSAAAEMVSPDKTVLLQQLRQQTMALSQAMQRHWQWQQQNLQHLMGRLQSAHPNQQLHQQLQRLDDLEQRLRTGWRYYWRGLYDRLQQNQSLLAAHAPLAQIRNFQHSLTQSQQLLSNAWQMYIERQQRQLMLLMRGLDAVSPLATLQRGYALVTEPDSGRILRDADTVHDGDNLTVRLAHGQLNVVVKK